ncbi:MAG: hypothetical protein WBI77_05655 [Tepidanaerobacteraceae bacterium]
MQTKQRQRAGCTLTGTRQDAELPVNLCEVQHQTLEQQALIIGEVSSSLTHYAFFAVI